MAQDIYLKLSGIAGESQDARHANEIEVLDWDWSIGQPSGMHSGSGGGTGKCDVRDLLFSHAIDQSSPNLMQFCLTGKHIPMAVLTVRKAGGHPLEYLKITMHDVMVTSVAPVCMTTMRHPREEVGLSFARVTQEYVIQHAQGGSAGTVSAGYDIKRNSVI